MILSIFGMGQKVARGVDLTAGDEVFVRKLSHSKGPWRIESIEANGTVTILGQSGTEHFLKVGEYVPVVERVGNLNIESEIIVHRLKGKGIISPHKIGLDGTVAFHNSQTGEWEEFSPNDYTPVVLKTDKVKKGGTVFPLRVGWVGGWTVQELGQDGTVVVESQGDEWSRLREGEYVPTIEHNEFVKVKDKVIVTRPGMVGVWEIQHLGEDGRIALEGSEDRYTLLQEDYIPTVTRFQKTKATDTVLSHRPGYEGRFPILALGIDGSVLIVDKTGQEIRLKKSHYVVDASASRTNSAVGRLASGLKSLFQIRPKSEAAKSEASRWSPVTPFELKKGDPVMLVPKYSVFSLKPKGQKAWVYPLVTEGNNVEVVLANEIHDATQYRNSLISYRVPLSWLYRSTEPVTEEELRKGSNLDASFLQSQNETIIPRGFSDANGVLDFLKGKTDGTSFPNCIRSMAVAAP